MAGYDYVVVGAGSAGCALASRLSEDPTVRVCLVEAGPPDTSPAVHTPAAAAQLFRTELDWDYDSHLEPHCDGRRIYLPRGRVLGGTSSLNGMIYIRGNRADWDGWGVPGWAWADMLPYFLRSEDNERGPSEHHGVGGPLAVSDTRSHNPMNTAFVDAALEAGYPSNPDFNGEAQDGFGRYQMTQRDGKRASTAAAFLRPAEARPNLTVETNLQVHRVTFDGDRATGVVGRRLGEDVVLRAEREVILSAGAYNSPQLLMLSGVGPADQLRALGIPVVLDQPEVGANLQDHPTVWMVFGHDEPVSLLVGAEERYQAQYLRDGTGPLSSNGPESGGFVRTSADSPAPDVQFCALPVMFSDGGLGTPSGHALSYCSCLLLPASRGSLQLAGPDPSAKPRITHNYYAEESDMDTAVAGLRVGMEIARQKALHRYTTRPVHAPDADDDATLRAYVRANTQSNYHPAGTCAIGTVVDADLRVRGVVGLRVVDTSIMPTIVRGNTNAPAIAIAEKAADLVLGRTAPSLAATAG